jgi:hypothetical protein
MSDGFNLSYEEHFKCKRPDGRYISTMAAFMAHLRDMKPTLALPDKLTQESFAAWQQQVKETLYKQLATPQPAPLKLETHQREGYRVERWEFYPDENSAVPFLVLIPDSATEESKVPGVMCYLGSPVNKEFVCGEPQDPQLNRAGVKYPERNKMALYMAQNGMVAFVFENPGTAESSILTPPEMGVTHMYTRTVLCHGLLDDRIKGIVFNDFIHDDRRRYVAIGILCPAKWLLTVTRICVRHLRPVTWSERRWLLRADGNCAQSLPFLRCRGKLPGKLLSGLCRPGYPYKQCGSLCTD